MATNSTDSRMQILGAAMANNLVKVLPGVKSIPLATGSITPQQAVAQLNSGLGLFTAVANAKTPYQRALSAKKAGLPAFKQLLAGLQTYLRANLANDPAAQQACGVTPHKPRASLTAAEKAAAAAKAAVTRKANGTQGVKQKRKAALAASATTVVLGPDGQPLDGSTLPSPASPASGAVASKT